MMTKSSKHGIVRILTLAIVLLLVMGNISAVTEPAYAKEISVVDKGDGIVGTVEDNGRITFSLAKNHKSTAINEDCSRYCNSGTGGLTELVISDGITEIKQQYFLSGCDNIKKITIGKDVKYIELGALFSYGLEEISVSPDNKYFMSKDKILYSKDGKKLILCPPNLKVGYLTVKGPEEIASLAFAYSGIKTITISNTVKRINDEAFIFSSVQTLRIPEEGLEEIGKYAFYGAANLTKATIPASVKIIGPAAFGEKVNLKLLNKELEGSKESGYKELDYLHLYGKAYSDYAYKVVELVNKERAKAGLKPLTMDQDLYTEAMCRAAEINVHFSHTRTNGTSCFTISSKASGENIAAGQPTPESVVNAWMNSPGHRANIMRESTKAIGVGCVDTGGLLCWVQLFSGSSDYVAAKKPSTATQELGMRIELPVGTNQFKDNSSTINYNFSLTEKNLKLAVGEKSKQILLMERNRFYFIPETTNWTSQNEKVATVSAGVVTGTGVGKTKILAGSSLTPNRASLTVTTYGRERIWGDNRYKTSLEAAKKYKKQLGVDKFNTVIIASGLSFADALSGTYLAAEKNAPIILIDSNSAAVVNEIVSYVKSNTALGGTIYILGGKSAVGKNIDSKFPGYKVKRLDGKTRYETNIKILKEAGIKGKKVLVCTGTNYADSLSASSSKLPILLVADKLDAQQKSYLAQAGAASFIAVGGTKAVSGQVANEVRQYGSVSRVEGKTRYLTSTALAAKLFPGQIDRMILVLGTNFPDGLSGGPIGVEYGVPVILVSEKDYSAAKTFATMKNIRKVTILGGTGVVSNKVAAEVAAW